MTLNTKIYGKIEDEQWRRYVLKKLRHLYKTDEVEAFAFSLTMFENFFPQTKGFHSIQDMPLQKYGIENHQHIKIPTRDGLNLDAWFFPVKNPRATILVLHGSGYNMADHSLPCSKFLLDHHYQLLLFNARYWNYAEKPQEYVGFIGNDLHDVEDIIALMKTRPEIDICKLGIFGLSFGGYKAGLIASRVDEVKAAIIDAPAAGIFYKKIPDDVITQVHDRLKERYGFDLRQEEFNIFSQIKNAAPKALLFLHGEKDKVIPIDNTTKLYELAPPPKKYYTFPHSGHCDAVFTQDKEMYIRRVIDFLETYL